MLKFLVATCLALAAASNVAARQSDTWYTDWPQGIESQGPEQQVPAKFVTEIPHSLFKNAEHLLAKKSAVFIGNNYFPAHLPTCPSKTKTYLVRALYEHANTGTFEVYTIGTTLLVRHYALGPQAKTHRSALLVCLPFKPGKVYVATGGAM